MEFNILISMLIGFDRALIFPRWDVEKAFVAFLAEDFIREGVHGNYAEPMTLQVRAYPMTVLAKLSG